MPLQTTWKTCLLGALRPRDRDIFFPAVLTLRITAAAPETVTCFTNSATSTTCDAEPEQSPPNVDTFAFQRVCYCEAGGGVAGDPHIHSLRGAHYTLLQQGVFVAWNFSKAVPASTVPSAAPARGWRLLAAYAGHRFTTQGLLLLDPHSGQSIENHGRRLLLACQGEANPMAQGAGGVAIGRRRDDQPPSEEAARETG